ncbi:SLATT domain-containing protein [Fusobacterium sp. MFO224]|uniref:SLATT domain-containing protein n=1 Tax=Fusobacterium sp. MFO224 TaxID=3378070 RepID=UPI0038527529
MEKEKYNLEKCREICEMTLTNYINMKKRLSLREKKSNFILIYYSAYIIIASLTPKYFQNYNSELNEYFNIVISLILLNFSLINGNAHYGERIMKLEISINKLKTLKRKSNEELKPNEVGDCCKNETSKFMEIYNNVVDSSEMRSDRDFYLTVKQKGLFGKYHLNMFYEELLRLLSFMLYVVIFLIPVVLFLICLKKEL